MFWWCDIKCGTSFEFDTDESRILSLVSQQDNKKLTVDTKFDIDDKDEDVSLEEQIFKAMVTLSIDDIVTLSQIILSSITPLRITELCICC
jgi:hypothetical protein